jgi:hypothetical protein
LFFGADLILPALPVGRVQSDISAYCRKGGPHNCSVRIAKKSTEEQDRNRVSVRCAHSFRMRFRALPDPNRSFHPLLLNWVLPLFGFIP